MPPHDGSSGVADPAAAEVPIGHTRADGRGRTLGRRVRQRQAHGYGSSSFVSTANAICAKAVAEHDGHPFPVSNFDPLHPTARDLPGVSMYISWYGDASASVAHLEALAVPAKHHAGWEKLRALIDQVAANAQRQIAAAERSNVTRFEQTVTIARSLAKQIDLLGATPTASRQTHTAAHIGGSVPVTRGLIDHSAHHSGKGQGDRPPENGGRLALAERPDSGCCLQPGRPH